MGVEYDIVASDSGFSVCFEVNGRVIGTLSEQYASVQDALSAILASPRPEFRKSSRKVSRESLRLWADNTPHIRRLFIWKRNASPDDFNLAVEVYTRDHTLSDLTAETWKQEVGSRISRKVVEMKLSREVKNPADQMEEVYFRHARE